MDLAREAYDELTYYFKRFDPTHEHEEEVFIQLGYIDVQHLADRIAARVQMTTALMDTVCPPSTQFAAYKQATVGLLPQGPAPAVCTTAGPHKLDQDHSRQRR